MPRTELSPLLDSPNGSTRNYYFLDKGGEERGTTDSVRDVDGGVVVENLPKGASAVEFMPRKLNVVRFLNSFLVESVVLIFKESRIPMYFL